jgi:hypothetical protein
MSNFLKDVLPNVELTAFTIEDHKLYVIYEQEKRRVTKVKILANGLHDLCLCLDDDNVVNIREIAKVPPEKILRKPYSDLLWLTLEHPIGTQNSLILEINDSVKKVISMIFQNFGSGTKGRDFDLYGGGNYGQ